VPERLRSSLEGVGYRRENAEGRLEIGQIGLTLDAADQMPSLECLKQRSDVRAGQVRHPGESTLRHVDERMSRPADLGYVRGSLQVRGCPRLAHPTWIGRIPRQTVVLATS